MQTVIEQLEFLRNEIDRIPISRQLENIKTARSIDLPKNAQALRDLLDKMDGVRKKRAKSPKKGEPSVEVSSEVLGLRKQVAELQKSLRRSDIMTRQVLKGSKEKKLLTASSTPPILIEEIPKKRLIAHSFFHDHSKTNAATAALTKVSRGFLGLIFDEMITCK